MQAVYEKSQAFGNTKNLWQHYERHHKDEYKKLMGMEKERQSADSKVKATCSGLKRNSTSDSSKGQTGSSLDFFAKACFSFSTKEYECWFNVPGCKRYAASQYCRGQGVYLI